jgi:DNA-binding NtrC family response regulator
VIYHRLLRHISGPEGANVGDGREELTVSQSSGPDAGKGTVVVIDDCESVLRFVEKALRRHGYDVCLCANGKEGLELYKERCGDIDLVILDMVMPKTGGEIIFGALKKIDPEARVVVASAYAMDGVVAQCMADGALGFLNKPYDLHQLLEAVEKWARKKE